MRLTVNRQLSATAVAADMDTINRRNSTFRTQWFSSSCPYLKHLFYAYVYGICGYPTNDLNVYCMYVYCIYCEEKRIKGQFTCIASVLLQ